AIVAGSADLAFGNVLGSFVANLTLVVGLSAVFAPLASNAAILGRDAKVMILVVVFLGFSVLDPFTPTRIIAYEGIILLLLFLTYVLFLYDNRNECETCYQFEVFVDYLIRLRFLTTLRGLARRAPSQERSKAEPTSQEENDKPMPEGQRIHTHREVFIVVISCVGVVVGAQSVILGAVNLSFLWGISEGVIGLTVVAVGTSLPEIMVSVNSARRGFGRLLIGNVIGSNIVNITLGLGFAVLVVPASIDLPTAAFLVGLSLLISVLFYYIIRRDWRVTRREGVLLLLCYGLCQVAFVGVLQLGVF
ncbi:MAG: sodium:calcium antiporter, partial [Candidatus Sifarchaeia archaeon]